MTAVLAITALLAPAQTQAQTASPSSYFTIGVYLQPTSTFATWKARGVNTVVDFDPNVQSLETWNTAANQNGLYMIRAPRAVLSQDTNEKNLVAWSIHDEPELNGLSISQVQAQVALMKATAPSRPVYVNFSGWNVLSQTDAYSDTMYQQYLKGTDWTAQDIYPVTGWNRPDWIDYAQNVSDRWNVGMAIDKLRQLSGGKRQYAYIETSNQQLSWVPNSRGPTADEVRGEVWDALIHGAKGIIYFPQQIGNGFSYDATPASVVAEVTKQNALITSLAAVLNNMADTVVNRLTLSGSQQLEGAWREYNGTKYLFVLNMSHSALSNAKFTISDLLGSGATGLSVLNEGRSLSVLSGDSLTDSFGAYQLHVYTYGETGTSTPTVLSPVPEPSSALALVAVVSGLLMHRGRKSVG